MDSEPPQQRIIMAYVTLVLIWSTTPLAVVLSMRDLDAIWALSIRMGAAAVLSMLALRLAGLRMSWDRRAWKLYGVGSLSMFAAMLFTYLGARYIASGLISVLYGLSPLMVALLARLVVPGTVILPLQWVGMLTGLGGLAFIFLHGQHLARTEIAGVLWVLAGVLSYVVSAVWLKKIGATLHPLVQTNGALWLSALGCVLVLPFAGGPVPQHWPGTVTMIALVYSASFGSIVAMLCYFHLLRHISAHSVSLITLLTPVIALLLGVLLLGERFRPETLGGMALILGGLTLYYLRDIWLLIESRRLKNANRAGSL